ncbi:cytochrome and DOMON domain-containing protein [Sesamum alatum]|uniref:Cytochrome and DOMON domain-containing protein n=1 Tax=Sesamum alatum TaxID=300844 RepID=A0AAE2D0P7_9LAMI|nr:cytochrome and DOMON domain-containing protein [Sesamum alatum]
MASSLQLSSLLLIAVVALLISPATSQTCKSQTFAQRNTKFANCTDLPTLKAQLHWTYDPSARPNPTLNVAFIAPPARPEGWVAWALNPTGSGMVGAQALIAFKDTNGSAVVKTYNISSYSSIAESRISYEVLSKRAEFADGAVRIFATLALPTGGEAVNQVWQVGSSVKDGVPVKHDFSAENMQSRGTLQLVSKAAEEDTAPPPTNSNGGEAPTGAQRGNDSGGSSRICVSGLGLYGVLVLLGVSLFLGF